MTRRLPFPGGSFDAVMPGAAVHMFPGNVTRAALTRAGRLARPGGLPAFHASSPQGRPLRARNLPAPEPEPGHAAGEPGQAAHFFPDLA